MFCSYGQGGPPYRAVHTRATSAIEEKLKRLCTGEPDGGFGEYGLGDNETTSLLGELRHKTQPEDAFMSSLHAISLIESSGGTRERLTLSDWSGRKPIIETGDGVFDVVSDDATSDAFLGDAESSLSASANSTYTRTNNGCSQSLILRLGIAIAIAIFGLCGASASDIFERTTWYYERSEHPKPSGEYDYFANGPLVKSRDTDTVSAIVLFGCTRDPDGVELLNGFVGFAVGRNFVYPETEVSGGGPLRDFLFPNREVYFRFDNGPRSRVVLRHHVVMAPFLEFEALAGLVEAERVTINAVLPDAGDTQIVYPLSAAGSDTAIHQAISVCRSSKTLPDQLRPKYPDLAAIISERRVDIPFSSDGWRLVTEEVNPIDGHVVHTASSGFVAPVQKLSPPYHNLAASLNHSCAVPNRSESSKLWLKFNTEVFLPYSANESMNVRIMWGNESSEKDAPSELDSRTFFAAGDRLAPSPYGTEVEFWFNTIERDVIVFEVPVPEHGDAYFRFSLDGAWEAINEAQMRCLQDRRE